MAATHRAGPGHAGAVAPLLVAAVLAGPAFSANAPATLPVSAHTLRFSEFAFDPAHGEPALPAGWDRSLPTSPDLHLVQFDGPVPGNAPERLRAAGLEPVQYVSPDTYIVWGLAADRDRMRGQARVRWTGDFAPAYRVQGALRALRGDLFDVRVLIYRGAHADAVVAALSRIGELTAGRTIVNDRFEIAGLRLRGDLMRFAASVPGVYAIQPVQSEWSARAEVSAEININNVDENHVAYPGYQAFLSDVGLDGAGVTVAIVDEGIDEGHPDLTGSRLACTGGSCTTAASTHGTHVAGIVTGSGASGVTDANGFLRGLGVAPSAKILEQEFVMYRFLPGGVFELMSDSRRNGATISNNSWGTATSPQGYNVDSMMIDAGVRDADPSTPGNQPLFYVQSLGNGNGGVSSQGAPDEAKNTFVVGSTWAIDGATGNPGTNIDSLSSNSAHGPALDGRRIPHLVAPGCYVDSTLPDFGGGYDHGLLCGTSMAAPQVSGAAALFTQYYRRLPGITGDPSPALTKAALMSTAHDLSGNPDADGTVMGHRPDNKQGWGRLDVLPLVTPVPGSVIYFDQERTFVESGENWVRDVTPVDPAQPMRIMLVWTDAPGPGLGGSTPSWNNDLDLVVRVGGSTYRGNVFGANGWSTPGGAADAKNNAEGVFFSVAPERATIEVVASNINSDGVPGNGDETDQDFALVCDNCAYAAGFDLDPHPVTADACAPSIAPYEIGIERLAGFANPVALSLTGTPAGASASFSINPVAPGASSLLSINPGTAANGNYTLQMTGTGSGQGRAQPLYLRVRRAAPDAAVPIQPASGAVGVAPQPTLGWTAVPWAASYVVEVSTSPTFQTLFYTGYSATTSHKVGQILAENTQYYWRVRARNVCGFGAFSQVFGFRTRDVPDVLLVDDDWDEWGNFQPDYVAAMSALPLSPYNYAVTYDVWDVYAVMHQAEPDYASLALYKKVIWWSGAEDFYAGPTAFSEQALDTWFRLRGGCLLLSSADYIFQRGAVTDFMRQRLGLATATQDTGMGQVTGQGSVFSGLGTISLRNSSRDYSDVLARDATAEPAFSGSAGNAGIDKNGGYYRSAFLGFGVERLSSAANRAQALLKFLQWCDGLTGVDGDGDGVANGSDCMPGDPQAWGVPSPVIDLRSGTGADEFTWTRPASAGGALYDVLRSDRASDFWNATCVASGRPETALPASWDSKPLPGKAFFYLVRVRSACGTAPMGTRSDGTPRQGTACE